MIALFKYGDRRTNRAIISWHKKHVQRFWPFLVREMMKDIIYDYYVKFLCDVEKSLTPTLYGDQCYLFLYWLNEMPDRLLVPFHRGIAIKMIGYRAFKTLFVYWQFILGRCGESFGDVIYDRCIKYSNRINTKYAI